MNKPLESCVNGDGRPVHPPSFVLCRECFTVLDQQMRKLGERLGMEEKSPLPPLRPNPRMFQAHVGGDGWTLMACFDRMVELAELREIPQTNCPGQFRIFVRP